VTGKKGGSFFRPRLACGTGFFDVLRDLKCSSFFLVCRPIPLLLDRSQKGVCRSNANPPTDHPLHDAGADAQGPADLEIALALLAVLLDAFLYLGIDTGPTKPDALLARPRKPGIDPLTVDAAVRTRQTRPAFET
jgi:hypothetical protein